MDEFPYLIAIALIEQEGKRSMPFGGKSLKKFTALGSDNPGARGESIALELLLRLMQRTEEGSLRRAAGDRSLLLVEMPMTAMQEKLPSIKAEWLDNGDTERFLSQLKELSQGLWRLSFVKYQGLSFDHL